jgi:FdhD protein
MFKTLQDNSTGHHLFNSISGTTAETSVILTPMSRVNGEGRVAGEDPVAVEEPLEIWIRYHSSTGQLQQKIATTMRSPGADEDLARGWLKGEGIIQHAADIAAISRKGNDPNSILVDLTENLRPGALREPRLQFASAACGVCGRSDLEMVLDRIPVNSPPQGFRISSNVLFGLQQSLRTHQAGFAMTGGLHACALFDPSGNMLLVREDIGRHNALDKLIGAAMLLQNIDFSRSVILLSGRAGFELLQKAAMAGVPLVAAVGAPSSMALEVAREAGIALVGFLKSDRFNIYHDQFAIIQ